MQKTAVLLALVLGTGAAAGFSALRTETASAQTAEVQINRDNAELFLPSAYEQYLNLVNPSYAAINDKHIAVADENTVYVCDREKEVYGNYTLSGDLKFTQLQFSDDGKLYYSDSSLHLYELNIADVTKITTSDSIYTLSTFYIHGDTLYAMHITENTTELRALALDGSTNITNCKAFGTISSKETPATTFSDGILYCAFNSGVYAYDTNNGYALNRFFLDKESSQTELTSACAINGRIYYTEDGSSGRSGLYCSDPATQKSELCIAASGFRRLTEYNGKLYCIQNQSVRELSLTGQQVGFNDFEISSTSDSPHRLRDAGEMARANHFVATADRGNNRVTVLDELEGSYSAVPLSENGAPVAPEHVALNKDGDKLAVSVGMKIHIYEKKDGAFALQRTAEATRKVLGLTFVYDEIYFIAENNVYGYLTSDQVITGFFASGKTATADTLTNDVYGTLYVKFGGEVYEFSEEEFRKADASGKKKLTVPETAGSLQSDYVGNLWYLNGNNLYCNEEKQASISGEPFVYRGKSAPVSFALGFEDGVMYFGFGDYLVKMHAGTLKSLLTLNEIATEGTAGQAFSLHEENLFASVSDRAIGIEIDLNALKDNGEYYSYVRYYRTSKELRGTVLAETDEYRLVALFGDDLQYSAGLFRKNQTALLPEEDPTETERVTRYTSNEVALLYAPCLFLPAVQSERLARGTQVTVLSTAQGAEDEYALVEVTSRARGTERGYLPLSYLTDVNPLGSAERTFTVGAIKKSDGITLLSSDGEKLVIKDKTDATVSDNGDGTFFVRVERNGKVYTGTLDGSYIARGETDALRISLIIILSVLAILIIAGYVYLMFGKKNKNRS